MFPGVKPSRKPNYTLLAAKDYKDRCRFMHLRRILGRGLSKLVLLNCFAATLAFTASVRAFTFSSLRLNATNGTETYVFTEGSKIVPIATMDSGRFYRLTVLNPTGGVVWVSVCRTNGSFNTNDNGYVVKSTDASSTNGAYTFRIEQLNNCTNTPSSTSSRKFYIARAQAFLNGSPANTFVPGDTASIRVYGLPAMSNWITTWLLPNGATSCVNNAGSDCPDSSISGVFPATNGTYLSYPPWSSAPHAWNNATNYNGSCSGFSATTEGPWKLHLAKHNTNIVTLTVFNFTNYCTATPLTNLTRGVMSTAVFSTTANGAGPFTYAWFRNEAVIPGETNSTLVLTNLALSDAGTYSVEVGGPCRTIRRSAELQVVSCSPNLDVMLVIDRSGSMDGQPFIDARTACTNLIRDLHLAQGDQAGLVSYNTNATLHQFLTNDASTVETAVSSVPPPAAGTTISLGLQAARNELASPRHNPFSLPVIVLLSDGVPHSSADNPSNVLYNATLAKNLGVLVFTVGLGNIDTAVLSSVASSSNTFFIATNSAQFTALFHKIAQLLCRASTNLVVDGPVDQTVCAGSSAALTLSAAGCQDISYKWRKDGVELPNTTNVLTINNVSAADAGVYAVEIQSECRVLTNFATLTVVQPPSGGALIGQAVCIGADAILHTTPSGTAPFQFVWRKDGTFLAELTNATLVFSNITPQDAGEYSVEISNACGSVTNSARLTVNAPVTASSLPDATHCVGETAIFVTAPDGGLVQSITWRKDGVKIPGVTDPFLIVPVTSVGDAGTYSVEVASECNVVTNSASLAVVESTAATPLANATNFIGETAIFSTTASGAGPFTFAWRKDGVLIENAINSSLSVPVTSVADGGEYAVEVNGACNSVIHRATLTVKGNTTATPLTNSTNCIGDIVTFDTTAGGTDPFTFVWKRNDVTLADATNSSLTFAVTSVEDAGDYSVEVRGAASTVTNRATLTVNAPTVATSPVSVTNIAGETAMFAVTISGTGPFDIAWKRDGLPIAGATNSTFVIAATSTNDAGEYVVEVAGACNSVTNRAALTVLERTTATPLLSTTNCIGEVTSFATTPGGTGPFTFVWRKDGVAITDATNNALLVAVNSLGDAGDYSVEVSGAASRVTNHATLLVNAATMASAIVSATNCVGSAATFSTTAGGTGPFTFAWRKDGVVISGATNSSFTLAALTPADAGQYTVEVKGQCNRAAEAVTSSAVLAVIEKPAATGLTNLTVCGGDTVVLAPVATGTPPLNYIWRRNGTLIASNTNALMLANVPTNAAGTYSVEVANGCGVATNTMTLAVRANISVAPLTNFARCTGGSVTFATTITGPTPYTIQWKKDGALLAGKTNTTLVLANLTLSDAGNYTVEVTGSCNTITNSATLTVNSVTTATPLAPVVTCEGAPAAFSTTPSGQGPFTFVWRRNGTILANQTNDTLVVPWVNATNAGSYSVTVNGACGSVTNSATLTINSTLSSSMPTNLVLCGCDDGVLAPVVTGATQLSFRWYHDGALIPGATNNALLVPKANLATPGWYRVEVSGPCNTATNSVLVSLGKPADGFYVNTQRVVIPDFGAVDPYPSIIEVTCAPKAVSELRVTIYNFSHVYPDDVDMMLVSPNGQALMLMSDCGGTSVNSLDRVTLTFDDNALQPLQDTRRITNGVYRATNYGLAGDDIFDPPAPNGPTITNLAGFYGTNPNGQWRLYVVDDHGLDGGEIAGGWSLDFGRDFTRDPQLRLAATGVTNSVFNALLFGTVGTTCFIEGSTNMSHWSVLSTNQLMTSPQPITSGDPAFLQFRFFRASSCRNN